MADRPSLQYWTVWYPKAGATGLLLARGLIDLASTLLVHAAPDYITVEVSDEAGQRLARGRDLPQTLASPMCRLRRQGEHILREDLWPTAEDLGALVLLPGGEVGVLRAWWHADDHKAWRWQVEFSNHAR
jgi:hypothetical protein